MTMRLLTDYIVPCVLCEEPLEHVTIFRDDGTQVENSERKRLPHLCQDMINLYREGR